MKVALRKVEKTNGIQKTACKTNNSTRKNDTWLQGCNTCQTCLKESRCNSGVFNCSKFYEHVHCLWGGLWSVRLAEFNSYKMKAFCFSGTFIERKNTDNKEGLRNLFEQLGKGSELEALNQQYFLETADTNFEATYTDFP